MPSEKTYDDFVVKLSLASNSRAELRRVIVNAFLDEKKGYWKKKTQVVTRYKYFVEKLNGGNRIYLLRPTFLNKGIDFQVWVEKFDGEKDKRPSHRTIIEDVKEKLKESPTQKKALIAAIERVWNCEDPDKVLSETPLKFKKGLSAELILKALKWLFIEQDVTYWNYDGRMMLWRGIQKESDNL
jgi:hypothetical protein